MDNLYLEAKPKTPEVNFNASTGVMSLRGKSIHEEPTAFYGDLNKWILQYFQAPCNETIFNITLEYFNTASERTLLDLLRLMVPYNNAGHQVKINWYYSEEDDDMLETIEAYQKLVKIPVNPIAMKEEN